MAVFCSFFSGLYNGIICFAPRFRRAILELVVIHWAFQPVRLCNILRCLSQVSTQHLQVSVPHQLLQAEYVYPNRAARGRLFSRQNSMSPLALIFICGKMCLTSQVIHAKKA